MMNERFGLIAATIVNSNPYRKKGSRVCQPTDFFKIAAPESKTPKRSAPQAIFDTLKMWCGGKSQ